MEMESVISKYSKKDIIRFNDIRDIVNININTWCRVFNIDYEQYKLLKSKNPPLDPIAKSLLFFMAHAKQDLDYVGFMRLVDNMDRFLLKYATNINICSLCGNEILNTNQKYCSPACRQKAYRDRKKKS